MTRYFMTIPEAVSLVIQAGAMGAGGEVFILEGGFRVSKGSKSSSAIISSGAVGAWSSIGVLLLVRQWERGMRRWVPSSLYLMTC